MTKTSMTAADKDALIAAAAEAGLTVTRTSKDFFLGEGEGAQRVTPGEIKRLIAEAQADEQARAEALEVAEQIRAQEAAGQVVESEGPAEVAQPTTPAEPARVVIRYGPPCGGDIGHLEVATSEHARNPIVHLALPVATRHKSKDEAAAAGRRAGARGHLAFLAQDETGEQFWAVANVAEQGHLTLDDTPIDLTLLEGRAAEDARAKVKGARNQAKAQWLASAV